MSPRQLFQALLYLATTILPSKSACCTEDDQLMALLAGSRRSGAGLFSSAFAGVTVLGCRNADGRLELLRALSRMFVAASVLDVAEATDRVGELAWEKGYKDRELPFDAHRTLFVLDLDCPDVEDFLQKASQESLLAAPYKWIMLQRDNSDADAVDTIFANANVYPDNDITIWRLGSGQLMSLYKTSANASEQVEDRGYWKQGENELVVRDTRVASRRRWNLGGTMLKSCLVITHPDTINHLSDYHDRHIDSITKCNYPWVLHLVNMFNATISFERASTWGYMSPNGSWGGMIGMLQRGEIDFGGTGTFLLRERIGVIQYISLSTPTGSRFIFRQPPLSTVSNLFRLPFRNTVWLGICALVLLLVAVLYPAMRTEWSRNDEWTMMHEPQPPDLSDDLLVIVGAVSQQGSWYEPRTVSTRIIVLMGLLAALNLYAAYTANIVALLQSTTTSIKTLQNLLDSPLTLAAHDNVYNKYYFKSFKDPVRRQIYEERIEPKGRKSYWMPIEDGVELIRRGYFAFHVEPGCAYKIIQETFEEDEKCGFQEIDYLNVFDPHFIVKRRSQYLELLRVGALRLHESGLRTRDISRLYTKKPICGSAMRFLSVGLTECYGAFVTLLYGVALAIGVFVAEVVWTKLVRPRCKSSSPTSSARLSATELVQ